MNVSDAKKLRQLTWAYLKRPDPFNWLLAADLLEENGLDEESQKWRWRAESLPALDYAIETARAMDRKEDPGVTFLLVGVGSDLALLRCRKYLSMCRVEVIPKESKDWHDAPVQAWGYVSFWESQEKMTKAKLTLIDSAREYKKRGNQ